jgi:cytochrome c oxidase assembly protein subunit 15
MVKLLLIIGLASLEGLFGWIMVASGLNEDNRTWVSAYKLLIHLSIATFLFAMLVRTYLSVMQERTDDYPFKSLRKNAFWLIVLVIVQIMFGGLMAGMRAGLIHPYFPIFLHWDALNAGLHSPIPKTLHDFVDYEPNAFLKFIVQILHRSTAGILVALLLYLFWKGRQITGSRRLQIGLFVTGSLVCIQFLLGVITITQCVGHVPAFWGVLHQGTALILLASLVYVHFQLRGRAKN